MNHISFLLNTCFIAKKKQICYVHSYDIIFTTNLDERENIFYLFLPEVDIKKIKASWGNKTITIVWSLQIVAGK